MRSSLKIGIPSSAQMDTNAKKTLMLSMEEVLCQIFLKELWLKVGGQREEFCETLLTETH
jgi:hypothetical protein